VRSFPNSLHIGNWGEKHLSNSKSAHRASFVPGARAQKDFQMLLMGRWRQLRQLVIFQQLPMCICSAKAAAVAGRTTHTFVSSNEISNDSLFICC